MNVGELKKRLEGFTDDTPCYIYADHGQNDEPMEGCEKMCIDPNEDGSEIWAVSLYS